ncbi:MAG: Gfo/Idh/MocA family oxidoreductase [Clostridia bacterium]|nr:Gfo/Idh/MocA family oxidoreductase [Clostridia bacterium]
MERTVNYAIVGCGRIAPFHADGIAMAPSARLVAVCDIVEEKARDFAASHGNVKYYTDAEEMFRNESIDVCSVCVPSGNHHEIVILAAKYGINVLCEKPLDVNLTNMQAMVDACNASGVRLGAIFQRRTYQAAQEVKKAIDSGAFGKITLASASLLFYRDQEYYDSGDWRGTWELDGGGALMNQGVHGIDMIAWLMGGVESVNADCQRLVWDTQVEDTAVIRVRYKNGAIGTIEGTTSVYPGLETIFRIGGEKGSVIFGDNKIYKWIFKDNTPPCPVIEDEYAGTNCSYDNCTPHAVQIEDMAQAIINGTKPMLTGEEAIQSVKVILSIYRSARESKEIKVDNYND